MLGVSPLKSERNEKESKMQVLSTEESEFGDVADAPNLLDSIDFDDLFAGISDGDVLPDLEMDHENILAQFTGSEMESSDENNSGTATDSASVFDVVLESPGLIPGQEIVGESKPVVENPSSKESDRNRKNSQGKKKAKVDWTPELHRRFVTAVEQLGIDKAVPSRILEIMGIDCLTRHNIASHLQKYRSHRKHLLAREAEAASWSRRRQMYGTAVTGVGAAQTEVNPWIAPTIGFPPVTPFRPLLHVWGHPSVDQSLMYMWPKHVALPPPPQPSPLVDPSFWHPYHHHQYAPAPGTLCFPPQFPPTTRFPQQPAADVQGAQTLPRTPSDVHPSKESIDAAIGDVLTKPWLPLPLGLKPPSIDGVMVQLQRQGVSKIPPT